MIAPKLGCIVMGIWSGTREHVIICELQHRKVKLMQYPTINKTALCRNL